MTIIKPISRRWLLGGLLAAPAIVAASSIMPVRAMEWIGVQWEGTAGDFAWREIPDVKWPIHRDPWVPGGIELKHRSEMSHAEWMRLIGRTDEFTIDVGPEIPYIGLAAKRVTFVAEMTADYGADGSPIVEGVLRRAREVDAN